MKELKFRTNINCQSCVNAVSDSLNSLKEINDWDVDTQNPNKILTVHGESLRPEMVEKTVEGAGFKIYEVVSV